jgi:hypothetical protein
VPAEGRRPHINEQVVRMLKGKSWASVASSGSAAEATS